MHSLQKEFRGTNIRKIMQNILVCLGDLKFRLSCYHHRPPSVPDAVRLAPIKIFVPKEQQ